MSYANDVRNYCNENVIDPSRRRGEKQITIRAGDIPVPVPIFPLFGPGIESCRLEAALYVSKMA